MNEQHGGLARYWYVASASTGLGTRRPLAATILDTPLVLFRDTAGRPAALLDRCPHRNAPLSRGRICEGTVECPYHGWRFDGEGGLVEVPARPEGSPVPHTDGPRAFPCMEQQGYIWVCLSDSPATPAPHRFLHVDAPGFTTFRMDTLFDAPVESCLENFLDCPHATHVHRFWFRAPTGRPVRALTRTLTDGAETEFWEEPREKSLVWALLAPRRGPMRHTDRFVAPATSQVEYDFPDGRAYSITSACTPLDGGRTRVHTVISFRFGHIAPLVRLAFEPLSRVIIRQDVRMLAMQSANIRRFGGPAFHVVEQDVLATHIRDWRRALRAGEAPPAAGAEQHVDLRL